MHGAFKLGQRWKEAAMDGLEFVGCQLAGSAWQHFYPSKAKRISLSMILVMSFNGCASQLYNDHDEQLELCVDFTTGCGGSQSESSE